MFVAQLYLSAVWPSVFKAPLLGDNDRGILVQLSPSFTLFCP